MNLELEPTDGSYLSLMRWRGNVIENSWARRGSNGITGGFDSLEDGAPVMPESLEILGRDFCSLWIHDAFEWEPAVVKLSKEDYFDFSLEFGPDIEGLDKIVDFTVSLRFPVVKCTLNLWSGRWTNPWSVGDFTDALASQADLMPNSGIQGFNEGVGEVGSAGFLLEVNRTDTLRTVLSECDGVRAELLVSLEDRMLADFSPQKVLSVFRFPPEVETACQQYLIYFIQFLKDMGIEASGDLWHREADVLFSVTPKHPEEGLERIRSALGLYLQLPGQRNLSKELSGYQGIAIRQLEANVMHLRAQLTLASAVVEAKEETIGALRFLVAEKMPDQDREVLVEGVEVTPYSRAGIRLDLPAILRRLKRVLSK